MALGGRSGTPSGVPRTKAVPVVKGFTDAEYFTQDTDYVSAAITEADDTLVATSTVLVGATAAITEAADTVAATTTVLVSASTAITEAADSVASTATVSVAATAALTEADDSVAATATGLVSASAALTEDDDSVAASATVPVVVAEVVAAETLGGSGAIGGFSRKKWKKLLDEIRQELRDEHEAGAIVSSSDTLAEKTAVAEAQIAQMKPNDDEEAIMVLLLAA